MSRPNELSFLPDDYLERKAEQRTIVLCAVLCTIVGAGIAASFLISQRNTRAIERRYAADDLQCAEAAKQIEQFQQIQDKQRKMTRQWEIAGSLLERVPRHLLLAELTNRLPPDTALIDLALESKRVSASAPAGPAASGTPSGTPERGGGTAPAEHANAAFQPMKAANASKQAAVPEPQNYDVTLRLTGMATTDVRVAQYMSKLSQSPLLKDVNLVVTEVYQSSPSGEKLRKFQIEAMIDPKADVQATTQPSATAAVELGGR